MKSNIYFSKTPKRSENEEKEVNVSGELWYLFNTYSFDYPRINMILTVKVRRKNLLYSIYFCHVNIKNKSSW